MKTTYPPTHQKRCTPPHSRLYMLGVILCALGTLLPAHALYAQDATPAAPLNQVEQVEQAYGSGPALDSYLPFIATGDRSLPLVAEVNPEVNVAQADAALGTALAIPTLTPALPNADARRVLLPFVSFPYQRVFRDVPTIPVSGPPTDRPAAIHGDLNLGLRSYAPTTSAKTLINVGGDTDGDPPQLAALFRPTRRADIVQNYSVYDWNWACGAQGCRGALLAAPTVTLFALATTPNEAIYLPSRDAEIYGGGYTALVLYADDTRITLKYTREDSPVYGYTLHVEDLLVDPSIVARYREMDAAGRDHLPALSNGDLVGHAYDNSVKVAIRDSGSFMDPRVRKDWWQGW